MEHNYIVITMESKKPITNIERKKYLDSLMGSMALQTRGTITKFNNAMGYKPVIDDMYTQHPILVPAKVESPKGYESPEDLFYHNMFVDFSKKGIVKFIIPNKLISHPNKKFAYAARNLTLPFKNFLQKIYPETIIRSESKERVRINTKDWVLGFMLKNLDLNEDLYTVECSLGRYLTEKEVFEIERELNACTSYKCKINQFECETCKGYNPEKPIHVEIQYL